LEMGHGRRRRLGSQGGRRRRQPWHEKNERRGLGRIWV
jgi:hypothetical protein